MNSEAEKDAAFLRECVNVVVKHHAKHNLKFDLMMDMSVYNQRWYFWMYILKDGKMYASAHFSAEAGSKALNEWLISKLEEVRNPQI